MKRTLSKRNNKIKKTGYPPLMCKMHERRLTLDGENYNDKIILFALHRAIYIVSLIGCKVRAKNTQSKTIQASDFFGFNAAHGLDQRV